MFFLVVIVQVDVSSAKCVDVFVSLSVTESCPGSPCHNSLPRFPQPFLSMASLRDTPPTDGVFVVAGSPENAFTDSVSPDLRPRDLWASLSHVGSVLCNQAVKGEPALSSSIDVNTKF